MADNVRLLHGKQSSLDSQPIVGGKVYFAISDEGKGKIYFDVPGQVFGTTNPVRIEMNDEVNFATKAEQDALGNNITSYLKTLTQNGNKVIGLSAAGTSHEVNTVPFIVGAHTSKTNAWTGSCLDINELYDGLTILYYLPYAGNGSAVTLNLNIANGVKTGAIPCYYKATETLKGHYQSGTVILLTYRKNATGENISSPITGWFANAQFDDGNSEIIAYKKTSGTYPILGSNTSLASITTAGTSTKGVVSSNEISMSPETGTIKATTFDGVASKAKADEAGNIIASTYISDIKTSKGNNNEHVITFTKGGAEHNLSLSDIDTHVHADSSATTKAYLMGSVTDTTGSKTAVIDPNIYTTTTAGELVASQFTGDLQGNAASATKASQDSAGNVITATYVKTISLDGENVKVAKGAGSATTAFTIPDKKVNITLDTDAKAYLLGTTTTPTTTGVRTEAVADTGVYLSTTPGELVATTFKGNLSGKATTAGTADTAKKVAWSNVEGKPNPVTNITDENNTIVYTTSDGNEHTVGTYAPLENGIIPLDYVPKGAREELKVYNSLTAIQTAITNGEIQVGDTALDNSEGIMYYIYNNNGTITYQEYKAGKASSVDWGDVQNKPDLINSVALDSTKTKIVVTKDGATTNLEPSFLKLSGGTVSGKTTFSNDVVLSDITVSDGSISNTGTISVNSLDATASGVSVDGTISSTGDMTAPAFHGVADKATQDGAGQNIAQTYIKDISASGKTITVTRGDATTFTETVADPTVTQTIVSDNANYPILLANKGQTTTTTTKAYFDSGVTINPSTNTINANLSGKAATAGSADSASKATTDANNQNIAETYIKGLSASGRTITITKGDGTTSTLTTQDTNTDTKNTAGATDTAEQIYLIGATAQTANPQTYSHDTVYVDANGKLHADVIGSLEGNATSANKAANDNIGQDIADTYIKDATVDGKVITFTKGDGDTFTITTQDTTTDTKVTQTVTTNGTYPLLLSNRTAGTSGTTTARFDSGVTLDTATNTIAANISGKAATAGVADEAAQSVKGMENFKSASVEYDETGADIKFVTSGGAEQTIHVNDEKVSQTAVTTGEYPLLLAEKDTNGNNKAYYDTGIVVDTATNTITANISGKAETAGAADSATTASMAQNNYSTITQHPATGIHSFTLTKPNGQSDTISFNDADTKNTVGTKTTDEQIYLVGAKSIGSQDVIYAESFTNSSIYVDGNAKIHADGFVGNITGVASGNIQSIMQDASDGHKIIVKDGSGNDTTITIPDNNTKNTAGSTNTSSKIFLIGATSQAANPQTYSHDTVYVETDGKLHANLVGDVSGKATTAGTADKATANFESVTQSGSTLTFTTSGGSDTSVTLPNTDTKNTAGSIDTTSKIFLIGATEQSANPQTYSHDTVYVGTDGKLHADLVGSVQGNVTGVSTGNIQSITQNATDGHKLTIVDGTGKSTEITIPDNDTKYTLPQATSSKLGGVYLHGSTGEATTGTMTQKAITAAIAASESAVQSSTKAYTDSKFDELLGPGATDALDTIKELADAISEHQDVTDALNEAIGNKADKTALESHTKNTSNPHEVTLSQLGVTATAANLNILDGATVTTAELNALGNLGNSKVVITDSTGKVTGHSSVSTTELGYLDGVTSKIQTQLNAKAASADLTSHVNNKSNPHAVTLSQLGVTVPASQLNGTYAGSDTVGGKANSAKIADNATTADTALQADVATLANGLNIPRITTSVLQTACNIAVNTEHAFFAGSDGVTFDCPARYCIVKIQKGDNHRTLLDCYHLETGDHYINGSTNAQGSKDTVAWTGWVKQPTRTEVDAVTEKTDKQSVYYVKGTGTTAGTWTGIIDSDLNAYYNGLTIAYYVNVAGASTTTLNLTNSAGKALGAVTVRFGTTKNTTHLPVGSVVLLTYSNDSGTGYWQWSNYDTNTVSSAYCSTSASTAGKTASCSGYTATAKSYLHVMIANANTAKSAITLNVNGKGAKPIYINGAASSSTNYTLPAGSYIVYYDGTNYQFRTDGLLPGLGTVGSAATATLATSAEKATGDELGNNFRTNYVGKTSDGNVIGFDAATRTLTVYSPSGSALDSVVITSDNTDTKDTTGTKNTTSTMYLVGTTTKPTSSTTTAVTVANDTAYVDGSGYIYSNGKKVYAAGDINDLVADVTSNYNGTDGTKLTLTREGGGTKDIYTSDYKVLQSIIFESRYPDGESEEHPFLLAAENQSATTTTGSNFSKDFKVRIGADENGHLYRTIVGANLDGKASTAGAADSAVKDGNDQEIAETYIKSLSASGKTITITKGDGTTSTLTTQDTNTDTKVNVKARGTTKAYLLGTTTAPTASDQAVTSVAETGVYFDTTAGKLVATTFKGALEGKATSAGSADKATKDSKDQDIADTYIKNASVNGKVITFTRGDGDTFTISTQDTNTDTKVTQTAVTTGTYPLLLAPSGQTATTTTTANFKSGVTLNTATNTIAANISGTAATATIANKATKDGKDQNIADTYIKDASVNGKVITFTRGDGDTFTITTQDTNTDTKVRQYVTTGNVEYPLLTRYNATALASGTEQEATYSRFAQAVTLNPSTGSITAPGGFKGNADTATYADSAGSVAWDNVTAKPFSNLVETISHTDTTLTYKHISGTESTWKPKFLPLSGGTVTGNIAATTFVGNLTGKATTAGVADSANAVAWGNVSGKPQLVQEIAYDSSTKYLTKTLVGGKASEVVKVATLDGNNLIPLELIPKAAQERVLVVTNDAAKDALTTNDVQVGDVVKVTDTGLMYYVTGASGTTPIYQEFIAGNAAHASTADTATVALKDAVDKSITRYFADASSTATSGTAITFTRGDGSSKVVYAADTDTKNTAGATDTSAKIFLVGATAQGTNPQTYSHDTVYVNTDGKLHATANFVGSLEGNAASATKAEYDNGGSKKIADYLYEGNTNTSNKLILKSGAGAEKVTFTVTDRDSRLTGQAWTNGTTAGPVPTFTITNNTYTGATKSTTTSTVTGTAAPVASPSISGVVNTSTQSFGGQKTFNNDVIVREDASIDGQVTIGQKAVLKYNGDIVALEFTFI